MTGKRRLGAWWLAGFAFVSMGCGEQDGPGARRAQVPAAAPMASAGGPAAAGTGSTTAGTGMDPMAGPAAGSDSPSAGAASMQPAMQPDMQDMQDMQDTQPQMPDEAGMTTGVPVGDPAQDPATACPAPPPEASPAAVLALNAVNHARLAAGSVCATHVQEISVAAQNHCAYYAQNEGECTANAHSEVESCAGFTGEGPGQRMRAAGYDGRGGSEVMAFVNDPERSVQSWIDTVWHRIPILDPWTTHMGYGAAERCDTIDFGRGMPAPEDTVVVWPYANQVDVPLSFDGRYEGPMPPAPSTGWPSAYPVNVYAQQLEVTEHVITVDGQDTPLEHVWLTAADSNFLRNGAFMYPNEPFTANTTYRVRIAGSYVGGPLELEWTFTTGAERRRF